jgi:hypothetical protein
MTQPATPAQHEMAMTIVKLATGGNVAACARLQMLDPTRGRLVAVLAVHTPDGLELIDEHGRHVRTLR